MPDDTSSPSPTRERARLAAHETVRPAMPTLAEERLPSLRPSGRLRFVAGYFKLTGWLLLLTSVVLFVTGPLHVITGRGHDVPWWAFALAALQGTGHLWTGRLLSARRRAGGQMALAMLGLPILDVVRALARGAPNSLSALGISVLGCLLVLSVWRELDDD